VKHGEPQSRQIAARGSVLHDLLRNWHRYRNLHSTKRQLVTSAHVMAGEQSQTILVEAAMLITATRLRIARSMTLLAKVALEGVRAPSGERPAASVLLRGSSHPPSVLPL
jgi:hypothetical protein